MFGLKNGNSEKSSKDDVVISKLCFILCAGKCVNVKF